MPHDSPFRIRLRIRAIRAHGFYSLFSGKSYHKPSAYFEILWACPKKCFDSLPSLLPKSFPALQKPQGKSNPRGFIYFYPAILF